jgi:hypothetical protein
MNHRFTAVALLMLAAAAGLQAQPPAASDPWFHRSAKPGDFRAAKLPWTTFSIELPKDWQLAPGYGGILLSAVEKTRNTVASAAIVLEQMRLVEPLARTDIDTMLAGLETDAARQRDPAGDNFEQQVKETGGQRYMMIQYTRPGPYGQDRVVIYAIPAGRIMYRLICIAPAAQLTAKYQDTFAHVASTFKPMFQ